MPDLGPVVEALFPLIRVALGVVLRTTLGMFALALVLCGVSFWLAAQGSVVRGLLAALLALVLCAVLGGALAVKRAVLRALDEGASRFNVGTRAVGAVFDAIAGILDYDGTVQGERGRQASRTVERVPLARAEQALRRAIDGLLAPAADARGLGAWLRRKIQASLLEKVERITLARFRQDDATAGSVDLALVRDDLCASMDARLLDTLRGTATRVTLLFMLLAIAGACLGALALRRLPL